MTPVLFDEFETQFLICAHGLWGGAPRQLDGPIHHRTDWHADMAAKLINLVNAAQHHEGSPDVRITGSVSVIQRWLDSFVATGAFIAREHDLKTVTGAITAAREYLAQADIGRLGDALQILKTFELLEARNAISPADRRAFTDNPKARALAQTNDAQPDQNRPTPGEAGLPQGFGSAPSRLAAQPRAFKATATQAH